MSPAQQVSDYQREINENQKQVRDMVMESYHDIAAGKGRDCNEFFEGGCKKSCVYGDLSFSDKSSICKILLSIL